MAHPVERLLGLTLGGSDPHYRSPSILVQKYVDKNGLVSMLATMKSAGVAPGLNLKFCCAQTTKHASEGNITLASRSNVIRSPKHG